MKRFSIVLALAIVILLVGGVVAENSSIGATVTGDTEQFVKSVAQKKGIPESEIQGVKQIDFNSLPDEVNIKNIDNTTLAMYQIDVNNASPVYVITASQTEFKKELQNFVGKVLLNLGLAGEVSSSQFLQSAAGVSGAEDKGYVMIRDGSITGISTSLEVENSSPGNVAQIVIYKNGQVIGFRNTFDLSETGALSNYNTVGEGIINFNKGDIISVKAIVPDGVKLKDINTLLEITNRG